MKRTRNYPLLLASQFLSAFGDNAILAVLVGQLTYLRHQGRISAEELRTDAGLLSGILFVPAILLAPLAGYLNDRWPKTRWLTGGNLIKLAGTALCCLGVRSGFAMQAAGYFVVGIGTTLYGPAKYGILPEIVPREGLVRANGLVELLTLAAILAGYIVGSALADRWSAHVDWSLAAVAGVFLASFLLNLVMRRTPSNPALKFRAGVAEFGRHAAALYGSPRLGRVLAGTALFWFCGAAMKINFQPWGMERLDMTSNTAISLMGLWLSVGVMAGSILAGKMFKVSDLRANRLMSWLLAGVLALLTLVRATPFWLNPAIVFDGALKGFIINVPIAVALAAAGVAGGLFLIPLNAALQAESAEDRLGKTIAVQNLTDNLGMILAAGYCMAAPRLGLSTSMVFAGLAVVLVLASAALNHPPAPKESQS